MSQKPPWGVTDYVLWFFYIPLVFFVIGIPLITFVIGVAVLWITDGRLSVDP